MSLQNQQVINYCLGQIKTECKKQGMTYQDIAGYFDISLATAKRMMVDTDIRFERLLKLCTLVKLSLPELLEKAIEEPAQTYIFTQAQDAAFAKYPHLLAYFSELAFEQLCADEIANKHQLAPASNYLYLRALEKLGLIDLLPENKVRHRFTLPIGFGPDSLVLKQQYQQMIEQTTEQVLNGGDKNAFLIVKPLMLQDSIYRNLMQDMNKLIAKYAEISELNAENKELPQREVMVLGYALSQDKQEGAIIAVDPLSFDL